MPSSPMGELDGCADLDCDCDWRYCCASGADVKLV